MMMHKTSSGASGVTTSAQKRRMIGRRDSFLLWDLIVKCDDICFTHVLPRLNSTDIKFLYGVNTETRALIKRSSRKGDLKKEFKVEEMSSISTLEVAWENKSLWPSDWDETWFCCRIPLTNKLELLKWAREEKCDSSHQLGHNDLFSHATSKVDIDDISSILNLHINSLLRDDLLINFLVSVFTPYKNLRSFEFILGST